MQTAGSGQTSTLHAEQDASLRTTGKPELLMSIWADWKADSQGVTARGVDNVKQLDGAIKGMVQRGEINQQQAQTLRAELARGASLNNATMAAGIGAAVGAAAANAALGNSPAVTEGGARSQQSGTAIVQPSFETGVRNAAQAANLDMGGLKPDSQGVTARGIQNVQQMDGAIRGMVQRGEINQTQAQTLRAEIACGASLNNATMAAGIGAAVGAVAANAALGNNPAVAESGGARSHQSGTAIVQPSYETGVRNAAQATNLDMGGLKPDSQGVTARGIENVQQMDGAIKGMLARGEINQQQAATLRAELARGASLNHATTMAGIGVTGAGAAIGAPTTGAGATQTVQGGTVAAPGAATHTTITPQLQAGANAAQAAVPAIGAIVAAAAGTPPGGTQHLHAQATAQTGTGQQTTQVAPAVQPNAATLEPTDNH